MPKIQYENVRINPKDLAEINQANVIIAEYEAEGYDLTLRQLYYQFVARGYIPNNQKEYKRLGVVIGKARMAGLIDWESITDRTRMLRKRGEWENPQSILDVCARQFRIDLWKGQKFRPEVWIEKDALVGVFERVCEQHGVAYFSCRGYPSLSELWSASQRLKQYILDGQRPVILHFGDHDPSGKDMTRDIIERVGVFVSVDLARDHGWEKDRIHDPDNGVYGFRDYATGKFRLPFDVKRLALNTDQIEEYDPPPNPAKITDPRARKYIEEFGTESWELDALDPRTLTALVEDALDVLRDPRKWREMVAIEDGHRANLSNICTHYPALCEHVATLNGKKRK